MNTPPQGPAQAAPTPRNPANRKPQGPPQGSAHPQQPQQQRPGPPPMQYQQQAPQYPTGQPHFPPRQQGAYGPPQNRAFRDGPDTQPPNSYPLRDLQPSPYAQNAQQPHSQSPGHGMSPGFNPAIRTNPFNNHHYGSGFNGVDSEDESLNPPNRRDTTFSSSSQNSLFHGNDSEGKFFFYSFNSRYLIMSFSRPPPFYFITFRFVLSLLFVSFGTCRSCVHNPSRCGDKYVSFSCSMLSSIYRSHSLGNLIRAYPFSSLLLFLSD